MMISINRKEECCGCNACVSVCPKECIEMQLDKEGFWYPVIDNEICVNCDLCEKVCPIILAEKKETDDTRYLKTYAMVNKDNEVRMKSSSGGIFSLIAENILEQGGIVFGATLSEDCCSVVHIAIEDVNSLDKLRGSKYVQSDIGSCYVQAQKALKDGKKVLFSGTPCQIAGLKSYLGKEEDNLLCMDFICHGVPSPKVWKKYVNFRESHADSRTQQIFFRHKKYGWKKYAVLFEFTNNTAYLEELSSDLYMKAFLGNICLRPSCYDCRFKTVKRDSDITVADFWGINQVMPEMDDDKGTSLVMVHSEKGDSLIKNILDKTLCEEVDFNIVPKLNPAMVKSSICHKNREQFFAEIDNMDFDNLVKKYATVSMTVKGMMVTLLKKMGLWESVRRVYHWLKKV